MAYNSGAIPPIADPAAELIAGIEDTFNDHTGNWEFVEEVVLATIPYRVWRNRGSGVTNPNLWGSDFYFTIAKQNVTEVRIRVFEAYTPSGGTPGAAKMIRPVRSSTSAAAPNANGSFGDETNGFVLDVAVSSVGYLQATALPTTGFDWHCQATKDRCYVGWKSGAADNCFTFGIFETLLTASPTEPFPLYTYGNASGYGANDEIQFSRQPVNLTSSAMNWRGSGPTSSLQPLVGGIDNPTVVDVLHGGAWLVGRPLVWATNAATPAIQGKFRGQLTDALLLNNSGATMRNLDTVTLGSDVYVKMYRSGTGTFAHFIKRDAV